MEKKLVVKSNELIESRSNFTCLELKIMNTAISEIFRKSDSFYEKGYVIETDLFLEQINHKQKNHREEVIKIAEGLARKTIRLNKGTNHEFIIQWIKRINIEDKQIVLFFHDDIKPHLLDLKRIYTSYFLTNIISLKSKHSIKIYELLKQYEKVGIRTIDLQKLKHILGVQDKYKKFFEFENRILKTAEKELKKKTDIYFSYKKIKKGRSIDQIEFTIKKNPKNKPKIEHDLLIQKDLEQEKYLKKKEEGELILNKFFSLDESIQKEINELSLQFFSPHLKKDNQHKTRIEIWIRMNQDMYLQMTK